MAVHHDAAGILIFAFCGLLGFALDNYARSGKYSQRTVNMLNAAASVCGVGMLFVGPSLMFFSFVIWLWRMMP